MLKCDPENTYIFSDPHFDHKNICKGTTEWVGSNVRPFDTLEQMNDTIINNLNIPGATFICLGDWSFNGFDNIKRFRDRISGPVHLILGNHDQHIENNKDGIRGIFTSVQKELLIGAGKERLLLYHAPIASWPGIGSGVIHLHGHIHSTPDKIFGPGKMMDVGVDGNNYKPWRLSDILAAMEKRPIKSYLTLMNELRALTNFKDEGIWDHHVKLDTNKGYSRGG